ncbi:hypothetical protein D915_009708 [Fasciola hepatica]|uniref:Uncharacterized protein n=1 Tax=Fasciola hepatica TaxID=6192 RepID=A0A4E0RWA4_FASHE|nr:hypothetical protein D915_009708 [Fasciola hepatica]
MRYFSTQKNPWSEQEVCGTVPKPGSSSLNYKEDDEQAMLALVLCQSEMNEDCSLHQALQATQEEEHERELQRSPELSVRDYHCSKPSSDLK